MSLRTKLFQQFPWIGGVNTSLDESTIPVNQLTLAENCVFGTRGSRKKREGVDFDWDGETSGTDTIIGLHDFWFGATARSQRIVGVTDGKKVYSYDGGTRSADLFAGTAWGSNVSQSSFETLNNLCIFAVDGVGNVMKKWSGSGNIADLAGTPPLASICRQHLGRLWTNDKTNPDRLHYSTTANPEEWGGVGDSGAIDIGVGDGDPEGITAIFPAFKGDLFVAKRTKLYRISNYTPETFQITLVSSGIGCESHNSVATVDQDDIVFVSSRGIHSLSTTANYGDFQGAYLSTDIQLTFNEDFMRARLKNCKGAYLSEINSIAFAFTEEKYGIAANNSIWLYNLPLKAWYNWPDISCESLIVANDVDRKRFYIGSETTRVAKSFTGNKYDISETGTFTSIQFRVATGVLFLDDNPYTVKGFKRFVLYYKPVGTHTITVDVKVDSFSAQGFSYSGTSSNALLGSTFILGTSVLGVTGVMSPYSQSIDGYGRGLKVTITQSGTNEEVEIQGFGVEYEGPSTQPEVRAGDES